MIVNNTRNTWVNTLLKTASPVFGALEAETLRQQMPVEAHPDVNDRKNHSHLEAVGRSLVGIGPWLELDPGLMSPDEGRQRLALLKTVRKALGHAVDRESPDFLNFRDGHQPLVDAAFLAQGLLRAWKSVWLELPSVTQSAIVECMIETRRIKPGYNNWLLFSAMIETFLYRAGQEWDSVRIDYAIRQHDLWYKGDGAYGDGSPFHWDYYNSFVIQPMLYEIVHTGGDLGDIFCKWRDDIAVRAQRYAVIQERLIGPDGTFPAIGRSMTYRFGAFHHLALMVYMGNLPVEMSLASVRCALTAVMKKTMHVKGTFDDDDWLQIGLSGHQPSLGEKYISTGSLYLTLCGFLPLGLPESHDFWSEPDADWSSKIVWEGHDCMCDAAIT